MLKTRLHATEIQAAMYETRIKKLTEDRDFAVTHCDRARARAEDFKEQYELLLEENQAIEDDLARFHDFHEQHLDWCEKNEADLRKKIEEHEEAAKLTEEMIREIRTRKQYDEAENVFGGAPLKQPKTRAGRNADNGTQTVETYKFQNEPQRGSSGPENAVRASLGTSTVRSTTQDTQIRHRLNSEAEGGRDHHLEEDEGNTSYGSPESTRNITQSASLEVSSRLSAL